MAARERDRGVQLLLVVRLRDADRGAEPRRLDEDRVAERVLHGIAEAQGRIARHGDAAVAQDGLEQVLVHAERRGRYARADVRHAGELEQSLNGAVLAERPVQDRQRDVDRAQRPCGRRVGEHGETLDGA